MLFLCILPIWDYEERFHYLIEVYGWRFRDTPFVDWARFARYQSPKNQLFSSDLDVFPCQPPNHENSLIFDFLIRSSRKRAFMSPSGVSRNRHLAPPPIRAVRLARHTSTPKADLVHQPARWECILIQSATRSRTQLMDCGQASRPMCCNFASPGLDLPASRHIG